MIASRYNYYIKHGDLTIIFNGISERFIYVSNKNIDSFRNLIDNPDVNRDIHPYHIDQFHKNGFIVDSDYDERISVNHKYSYKQFKNIYRIMLLPTYECNLRCWYCTQKHESIHMSEDILKRVRLNISSAISSGKYATIMLDWFGGEPLLAYDEILALTSYTAQLCSKHNMTFICGITTNGTLLDSEKISKLRDVGITSYQITIYGIKSEHDSIKRLSNKSAFEKTLENIRLILPHTPCTLRFNYTHKNLKPQELITQVSERIPENLRKNIRFSIHKVWQEDVCNINKSDVNHLFTLAKDNHLNPDMPSYDMCYADQQNFFCIFPNGKVGKCDNSDIDTVPGRILNDGRIEWPSTNGYDIPVAQQSDSECYFCKYLPICWGPCVPRRKTMLKNGGHIKCFLDDREKAMKENIINRCITLTGAIDN